MMEGPLPGHSSRYATIRTPPIVIGDANDCSLENRGVQVEPALDFAELNPVAAALDHSIAAAEVKVAIVRVEADDVPGVVRAPAVTPRETRARSARGRFQSPRKTDAPLIYSNPSAPAATSAPASPSRTFASQCAHGHPIG